MTGPRAELDLTALPGPWRFDAACEPRTGDAYFVPARGDTRPAKITCRSCPVRLDCLAHALEHDEQDGIWGGLTRGERVALARRGLTAADVVLADAGGRMPCRHCDATFAYAARLAVHIERAHPQEESA